MDAVLTLFSEKLGSVWPVNFLICPCHYVSSLIILPRRFLGDHVVFELQYSYIAREPWILAVHIPESTTPTIKFWFFTRVTILGRVPFPLGILFMHKWERSKADQLLSLPPDCFSRKRMTQRGWCISAGLITRLPSYSLALLLLLVLTV